MAGIWDTHKQANTPHKRKVLVALSGGVDSALAATLLKEQGFFVSAGFMKNWSGDSGKSPCWIDEQRDAMTVAAHLRIPFVAFDFEKEYREKIVQYMVTEYVAGRTPNPDVICNRDIKFDLFLKEAEKMGIATIATGHYARIVNDELGNAHLFKARDLTKDQSYFLHALTQEQLSATLFPIGELTKTEVRKEAKKRGLLVSEKRSSRGICFVGKDTLSSVISKYAPSKVGNSIDEYGNTLGTHQGIQFYTIGQRHGFGSAGGVPRYVAAKNTADNTIMLVRERNHQKLLNKECQVAFLHWIAGHAPQLPFECEVKIRYQHEGVKTKVSQNNGGYFLEFSRAQWAVAPGQFAVLYQGDECLGGGVIQ